MPGLEDLYREIILDHYRNPRNRGELPVPPALAETGYNPLCGDEITVYLLVEDGRVSDLRLGGQGCSISQSSASMMSTSIKGKTLQEARAVIRTFKSMMSVHEQRLDGDPTEVDPERSGNGDTDVTVPEDPALERSATPSANDAAALGDLAALQGVVKFPVRIKCATLSWNTLAQALDQVETATSSS